MKPTNCCIHNRRVAMHIPCNKNSASINASLPESQRKNTKKTSKCQSLAVPKKTTTYPVHPWVNHQLFVAQNPQKKERQPTSVQSPLKLSSNESSSHVSPFPDFQIFIVQWPSFSRGTQPFHLVGCHSSHAAGASDARQGHGLNKPCSLILGWRVTPIVN